MPHSNGKVLDAAALFPDTWAQRRFLCHMYLPNKAKTAQGAVKPMS